MPVWVSLLRGINLASRNRVNMPRLRDALATAGFTAVRTYVQSGNVVADSAHTDPAAVAEAVRAVLIREFDVDVPVMVRTPDELRAIADWCPFPADAAHRPTFVHVLHLAAEPDPDRVRALCAEAEAWAPDELAVRGSEVVLRYAADDTRGSKLQYPKVVKRLDVDATGRNWRTLAALVDLTSNA
jgi:uncharacterized protein (DUF1697 family)